MSLFGKGIFITIIKTYFEKTSPWITQVDPKSNDKCFIGDRPEAYADTWRWWSHEDGGRDWSVAAVS